MGVSTDYQIWQANRAHALLHVLWCPSIADLKQFIKTNSTKNCPVTTEDINITKRIYGPDVASLKDKTVHQSPDTVANCKSIQSWFRHRHFCSLEFLTIVSKAIKFRTCESILNRKSGRIQDDIDKSHLPSYRCLILIFFIFSDQEFQPVLQIFKEATPSIDFKLENSDEHVLEAEWNNHTLNEQMHATFFTACNFRQVLQYLLDIWQVRQQRNAISFPQMEAYPPITVHAKF